MEFNQHNDPTTLIPQHISQKAYYSIPFCLMNAMVAFWYGYYGLSAMLCGVFACSLRNWTRVHRSIYHPTKLLDIAFATTTIYQVSFYYSRRFSPSSRTLWFYVITYCILMFALNQHNLSRGLIRYPPNTPERERLYWANTLIHMVFMHIVPTAVCAYCIVVSAH